MAHVTTKHCDACQGSRIHTNGTCNDCAARRRRQAEAAWDALTVEEKLADINRRLKAVERGPRTY